VSGWPQADAGAHYSGSGFVGRASAAAYPVPTSGSPADPGYPVPTSGSPADPGYPPAVDADAARNRLTLPLFLLTVIVVVLVSGTVAVVLIRANERTAPSDPNLAQAASPSAPPASAPPSAAASGSSTVDKCVVGEWTVTTWRLPYGAPDGSTGDVATSNAGTIRFRANGTGEWDFGSGVRLDGSGSTEEIAVRYTGRFTFSFRTVGQTFDFSDVESDVRQEITDSDKVTSSGSWNPELTSLLYACAGDVFRWSPGNEYETRMQRRG
jgi:hypothetical protein